LGEELAPRRGLGWATQRQRLLRQRAGHRGL